LTPFQEATVVIWIAHEIFWGLHARGNKETAVKGNPLPRLFTLGTLVIGFALLYLPYFSVGVLGWRVVSENDLSGALGVVLCCGGIALAWWARRTLGTNWSGAVTLKKEHELVRGGLYGLVRHPIYFGLLLAIFGSAVAMTQLKGFVAVVLVFLGMAVKVNQEETILSTLFAEYDEYRRSVKRIIPFVY